MNTITVETLVKKDINTVWDMWTAPTHIMYWMHASDDWECPYVENNVVPGDAFLFRMSAKNKFVSFDFTGVYDAVEINKLISYTITGGRKVVVTFNETPEGVHITETFDPENENPEEMQRGGWQAILDNFKKYAETK
jgi:uncharacterized protein YndB with AHSA1/START domain